MRRLTWFVRRRIFIIARSRAADIDVFDFGGLWARS